MEINKFKMNEYSLKEEKINIISHAIGFVFSIVALFLLVIKATAFGNVLHIVSVSIYGLSLIVLYAASTLYHSAKQPKLRTKDEERRTKNKELRTENKEQFP